jgi:hypothetical protein
MVVTLFLKLMVMTLSLFEIYDGDTVCLKIMVVTLSLKLMVVTCRFETYGGDPVSV